MQLFQFHVCPWLCVYACVCVRVRVSLYSYKSVPPSASISVRSNKPCAKWWRRICERIKMPQHCICNEHQHLNMSSSIPLWNRGERITQFMNEKYNFEFNELHSRFHGAGRWCGWARDHGCLCMCVCIFKIMCAGALPCRCLPMAAHGCRSLSRRHQQPRPHIHWNRETARRWMPSPWQHALRRYASIFLSPSSSSSTFTENVE